MKLNISYDRNGTVSAFEVKEDQVRRGGILGKRLGNEVDGSVFGDEFAGYTFKLRGGQDTEGFPMMYGVCAPARVSLLLARGATGYNAFRGRKGERRRKAVRGDIVGSDIAMLNVSIVKCGEQQLEGVTTKSVPRALGPKRVSTIRKLWNLPSDADASKFVVKRKVDSKGGKSRFKGPRVQRLITDKIRTARRRKLKVRADALKESASQRREFLSAVAGERMRHRQRKQAAALRKKSAKKVTVPV